MSQKLILPKVLTVKEQRLCPLNTVEMRAGRGSEAQLGAGHVTVNKLWSPLSHCITEW